MKESFGLRISAIAAAVHSGLKIEEKVQFFFLIKYISFQTKSVFKLWAQSYTSLMADLCQDMNGGFAFSRCLNGTFTWRKCSSKALVS